ncbi:MAG: beta-galactosidase [Bryobacteraceae bacterium]
MFLASLLSGADLILPSSALERDGPVMAIYRTVPQATGKGTLAIEWTDVLGRVVEARTIAVEMTDETEIRFPLDLRRALAMGNEVRARFTFDGTGKNGKADHREESATVSFVAKPADRDWWDYMIMMWQPHSAERTASLRPLGVNGGQFSGRAKTPPEFLLKNNLRWYAENIATDFYSEYHRYRPDRIQNWSFLQAKELYRKDPSSKEALKRHPSLSDDEWLRKVSERLTEAVRTQSPYRPVFYDLGDESGVADLASFWDFDFSDQSLGQMRVWLRERYGTLAALNNQWGSNFALWDTVTPQTTREAMKREDENYSSWSDFKEWMDVAFSRAIRTGVDAVRAADPDAYAGIAGGQMPGWGGYDYWRLSHALTAIEPYDIGNNIEMLRSFQPRLPFVTTAFAHGPWERHRVWYELLHGARGHIIWDEKFEMLGARGEEAAPYYNELRNGIGALLIQSERQADPIAIHYSQASMRAEWMLAHRAKGDAWINRSSSSERLDSDFLKLRESYCKLVEDLGLQYRFVSYAQLEEGELARRGYRVLILPRSSALSAAEVREIRGFIAHGGVVIADGEPGVFDDRVRRLPAPSLSGVPMARWDALSYLQDRLLGKGDALRKEAAATMERASVKPRFALLDEPGVETHTFANGGVSIVALLSNPELRVDELGPPEFKSNQQFEKRKNVRLNLPGEWYAYDVRSGKALGKQKELRLDLDPYEPVVLALSKEELPSLHIDGQTEAAPGDLVRVAFRYEGPAVATAPVIHVDVIDPAGKVQPDYSGNVIARGGAAVKLIPLAQNDPVGRWTLRVRDVITGQSQTTTMDVR